ncbi:hypothetical protein OEA41_009052 [Lepraria neglecta]|uniref:Uncharacterized protein n=1 Tax=Lepraria neglecta TaxID=209136 RepID=A0AAD9Z2Y7_9LECA|nr:hypothetical protein OEA41_009052 [Lepraria neglecta]
MMDLGELSFETSAPVGFTSLPHISDEATERLYKSNAFLFEAGSDQDIWSRDIYSHIKTIKLMRKIKILLTFATCGRRYLTGSTEPHFHGDERGLQCVIGLVDSFAGSEIRRVTCVIQNQCQLKNAITHPRFTKALMGLTGFETLMLENAHLRPRSWTVDPGSDLDLLRERGMQQLDTSLRPDLGISEVVKDGKFFYLLTYHPRNFHLKKGKQPLR